MANLIDIKNLVECGAGASLGTGSKGCRPFFAKTTAAWILPQGTLLDDSETLDLTYVQTLQSEGKLIVLNGVRNFVDNTPDDVTEELEDGTKAYIRGGKYEFSMDFINGLAFHTATHSLSSFGAYDVILVDRNGNLLGTRDSATGQLKGFTVGMMQGNKLTWGTDTTQQREGIMMQLLERNELDRNYVFIDNKNLAPFDANSVDGVNQVALSFSVAAAAGTSLTVKAVLGQGGAPVTGLGFADFRLTINGVTSNPTADDSEATGAGIYVLTVPTMTLNDEIVLSLFDTAGGNNSVITLANVLYKSNDLAATVI